MKKIIVFKKRGYMPGLAKHLAKKYGGDPGFFTKCMSAEEVQGYPEDVRKALCAKGHKLAIGKWPTEGMKKKEKRLLGRVRRRCCRG